MIMIVGDDIKLRSRKRSVSINFLNEAKKFPESLTNNSDSNTGIKSRKGRFLKHSMSSALKQDLFFQVKAPAF